MPLVTAGSRLTAAMLSEDYSLTDISTTTVAATTSTTQLSRAWAIPAGDADVSTTYRLTAFGLGSQGGTQQQFKFNLKPGGSVAVWTTTGFVSASTAFQWRLVSELTVTQTGSAGTCMATMDLSVGNTGATPNNYGAAGFSQSFAFNTTVVQNMFFQAWMGGTAGSPSVTCYGSIFERLGG